jgi:hypothetical protein
MLTQGVSWTAVSLGLFFKRGAMNLHLNRRLALLAAAALLISFPGHTLAQASPAPPVAATQHDGAHDFDFLLGNWKAHVKRLPDRLVGSTAWIEYDGISRTHPVLGSSANFEEFEVYSPKAKAHIRAQTLRL